jgi:hypothetical protein
MCLEDLAERGHAMTEAPGRSCPWCSTPATEEATTCASCGAALAQRESIGDLVIPGLTNVDPALQAIDGRPMRIPGPSPSQGLASGAVVAAAMGGPAGLAIMGGLAAVAAAEYAGARRDSHGNLIDLDDVGKPSALVLQALDRLDREGGGEDAASPPPAAENDPWRDEPPTPPVDTTSETDQAD